MGTGSRTSYHHILERAEGAQRNSIHCHRIHKLRCKTSGYLWFAALHVACAEPGHGQPPGEWWPRSLHTPCTCHCDNMKATIAKVLGTAKCFTIRSVHSFIIRMAPRKRCLYSRLPRRSTAKETPSLCISGRDCDFVRLKKKWVDRQPMV